MSKEKDPKEAGCLLLWSYREGRRKTSTKNGFVQDTGMRCGYDEEYMNIEAENTYVWLFHTGMMFTYLCCTKYDLQYGCR